jgi:hypothetical protein
VSSVGDGLPLIALGVAVLAFATFQIEGDDDSASEAGANSATGPTRASGTTRFSLGRGGLSRARGHLAEAGGDGRSRGALYRKVIGGGEPLEGPIGLLLEDRGTPLGAVRLAYDADGAPFYLDEIFDADCKELPVESHESAVDDVDGDDMTWIQYDEICIDFGAQNYVLAPGGGAEISFSFRRSGCTPS